MNQIKIFLLVLGLALVFFEPALALATWIAVGYILMIGAI